MKIGSSPKRASPMRSLLLQLPRSGVELHSAAVLWTRGRPVCLFLRPWPFDQSNDWAGRRVGTTEIGSGEFAGCWICCLAGRACGAGDAYQIISSQATPLISGGSKRSNAIIWSDCRQKCVYQVERGCSSRWNPPIQDRSFARRLSSIRWGCSDSSTGTCYIRSTN